MESCKFLLDNPYTKLYRYSCSDGQITCSSTSTSTSLQMFSSLSGKSRAVLHSHLCSRKAQCKLLTGDLVVRKKAPQSGTRMSILYIAHNLKFVKIYSTTEDREACLISSGLSTFLGGLLVAVCKRSAC